MARVARTVTEKVAPVDPFEAVEVYTADAFEPEVPESAKRVAGILAEEGEAVVPTGDATPAQVKAFIRQVKLCKVTLDGRRVSTRTGTLEGAPALLFKLGNPVASGDTTE